MYTETNILGIIVYREIAYKFSPNLVEYSSNFQSSLPRGTPNSD